MAEIKEGQKRWAKIVAKTWEDETFKKRLLEDPATVLAEEGVKVPEGKNIRVIEVGEDEFCPVLPCKPPDEELTEIWEERLAASSIVFTNYCS